MLACQYNWVASLPEVPILTNFQTNTEVFSLFFHVLFSWSLLILGWSLDSSFPYHTDCMKLYFLSKENFNIVFCLWSSSFKHLDGHPVEVGRAEGKRQLGTAMVQSTQCLTVSISLPSHGHCSIVFPDCPFLQRYQFYVTLVVVLLSTYLTLQQANEKLPCLFSPHQIGNEVQSHVSVISRASLQRRAADGQHLQWFQPVVSL